MIIPNIKILQTEIKDISEIEFPPILYKYRNWNDPYNKTTLTKREFYFAAPSSFEDKFDCKNPLRYDLLSDDELIKQYVTVISEEFPKWNEDTVLGEAKERLANSPMKNKDLYDKTKSDIQKGYDQRLGVLSLTADPKNSKMWQKYAADHTGFCIGIDPK